MVVPIRFRGLGEKAVASYDYTEVVTGVAKERYYLAKSNLNTGTPLYSLQSILVYSEGGTTATAYSSDTTGYDADVQIDFDLTIGKPRTIEGDFFANIMTAIDNTGGNAVISQVTLKVMKGTTELLVITEDGPAAGAAALSSYILAMSGTIPLTHFKDGEILRIRIMIGTKATAGTATGNVYLGHDPNNRTDAKFATTGHDRTDSQVIMPFRLEL